MTVLEQTEGVPVALETSTDTPLVWGSILARVGSANDPIGCEGLVRHAFEVARRGTAQRSRRDIDQQLDELGASLDPLTYRDYAGFTLLTLKENLPAVIEIACDILSSPAFDEAEHQHTIRESQAALDELRDDDASIAHRFFNKHVAPGYLYGRTALGTEESLSAIEAGTTAAVFEGAAHRNNLTIGFAGDVASEAAIALAGELTLACERERQALARPTLEPPHVSATRVILVDKPERSQSQILVGRVGPAYGTPDFIDLVPVETVFGGMFTSRLMQEVRVKRGWSYGASCRLSKGRGPHWLQINAAPSLDQTAGTIELILEMVRELGLRGIEQDELDLAQNYLRGQEAFERATPARRLSRTMEAGLYEVDADYVANFGNRVASVDLEAANRAARRWFGVEGLCIVIVSSAAAIESKLAAIGLRDVEVVAYDSY